jgi:two-component system, cell cycle response regulator
VGSSDLHSPDLSDPPLSQDHAQRVIVASSRPETRKLLTELCAHEGYEPIPFNEPEMLLRGAELPIDMVLPHVYLDDPNCFELCSDLRATEGLRHVPILLVTDRKATPDWVAAALLSGADDVCSLEDQQREELRARVRVQLRNKRYRDAISRLRAERNDLRSRNKIDALTGALGRGALEAAVQNELTASMTFAVLFVDVDHFKSVNDTYGHQTGDEVLKGVAQTLAHGCRTGDACGRYGGEEFILLLRQVSAEQAWRVAERHRSAVSRRRFDQQQRGPQTVTVSIGVAVFDPETPDPNIASLLARADLALYRAKAEGRDRVVMAKPMPTVKGPISSSSPIMHLSDRPSP